MGATIFEAPPHDPSKSQIENVLELTPVTDIGPVCAASVLRKRTRLINGRYLTRMSSRIPGRSGTLQALEVSTVAPP